MGSRLFTEIDVEQRSPEWFAARLGRVTGSRASKMLATTSTGKYAAGRDNLRWQLVLERLTGRPQEDGFTSKAMTQGIDREPLAVAAYEAATGDLVRTSGFLSHASLMAGASLDGFVGEYDVLVSVKCREPKAHAEHLLTGAIPKDARDQMRHELWLTGAKAHRYVSWNPDFPESLQLRIVELPAATMALADYAHDLATFLDEVAKSEAALRDTAAKAVA